MIRRSIKALSSLRFTLVLICSLSAVFLLGLWIPQKGLLKRELYLAWKSEYPGLVQALEAIGFTDIYTSPVTLTLWALFFLNLSLVMWQRVPVVRRKIEFSGEKLDDPSQAPGFSCRQEVPLPPGHDAETLPGTLKRFGFRIYGTPHRFYAVKNRYSPAATLLFHFSFFLLLLGGVVTLYTRFSAFVDLAEGEQFSGRLDQYAPGVRIPKIGDLPDIVFGVEKIKPVVEQETPTGLAITIREAGGARQVIEINRPYKADHTSFVIQNLGVAPLVVIRAKNGRELDGAYVKLNVLQGRQDTFTMAGHEFTVDFFSNYVTRDGRNETRSQEFRNPAFLLYIQRGGKFIARTVVRRGDTASFGNLLLSIPELRYWVRFYVVRERGLSILYTGFSLATVALMWRFFFYRRELVGGITQEGGRTVLHLAGRAEFYRALFEEEFERVVEALKNRLKSNSRSS